MTDEPRKRKLPEPRTITLPDQSYQPPKAEREKERDSSREGGLTGKM